VIGARHKRSDARLCKLGRSSTVARGEETVQPPGENARLLALGTVLIALAADYLL
jgi:hypothetical protein